MAFKMKGSSYKMGGHKTKATMAYIKSQPSPMQQQFVESNPDFDRYNPYVTTGGKSTGFHDLTRGKGDKTMFRREGGHRGGGNFSSLAERRWIQDNLLGGSWPATSKMSEKELKDARRKYYDYVQQTYKQPKPTSESSSMDVTPEVTPEVKEDKYLGATGPRDKGYFHGYKQEPNVITTEQIFEGEPNPNDYDTLEEYQAAVENFKK